MNLLDLARKVRDDWIRQRIADTLALTCGNVSEAAQLSGMDRTNFRRLMRRLGDERCEDWATIDARYRRAFAALNAEEGERRQAMLREARRGGRKSKRMRGAR